MAIIFCTVYHGLYNNLCSLYNRLDKPVYALESKIINRIKITNNSICFLLKTFEVRMFGRTPVTRWLSRLVRAQYLRIIPVEFKHYLYLRVEILGCTGGEERVCYSEL